MSGRKYIYIRSSDDAVRWNAERVWCLGDSTLSLRSSFGGETPNVVAICVFDDIPAGAGGGYGASERRSVCCGAARVGHFVVRKIFRRVFCRLFLSLFGRARGGLILVFYACVHVRMCVCLLCGYSRQSQSEL